MAEGQGAGSLAELLDRVVWNYRPRDDEPSHLVSTAQFFDEFPWSGEASPAAKNGRPSPSDS